MNPLAIATLGVQLAIKIIDLRLKHYEVNPELAVQDAANAEQLAKWGNMLGKAITKLFDAMEGG
jgi:hypothetical protein